MNKPRNLSFIIIIGLFFLLMPPESIAQEVTAKGIQWLTSAQQTEGSWDNWTGTVVRDTTTAADALQSLDATSPNYLLALQWLATTDMLNNDHASRRLLTFSKTNADISPDLNYLLAGRHQDGGWGLDIDHESSPFNTALALQALKAVNYFDTNVISSALSNLRSAQNPDGGFGFCSSASAGCSDSDSNVYMTALVSSTLQQFPQTTAIATAISKATSYLISHQNTGGGFGTPASTVFETAYAYMALIGTITDNTVLGNTINYLNNAQLANGSWNDDPYSTALALRALYLAENKPTPPPSPTTGTVTGRIVDASSTQPLNGVSVISGQLSATTANTGEFTLSNIPQGSQTINISLAGYATVVATVNVTAGSIINLGTIPLSISPTTAIIKGTVTDTANGQLLEGAAITVTGSFSGSAVTGIDGSFIFTDVTPGSVTITASKAGYYTVTGTGTVAAGRILFFNPQLTKTPITGTVTGRVLSAATGLPLSGVSVVVQTTPGISTITDAAGSFALMNVPVGTQTIKFTLSGYATATITVDIGPGVLSNLGTIPLSANPTTATIKGIVTDATTIQPLQGVTITVAGSFTGSAVTGTDGSFRWDNVTPGSMTFGATKAGYNTVTSTGAVEAGGIIFFNPKLSPTVPTGKLMGRVFDGATNEPLQGAKIALAGGPIAHSDSEGLFLIQDLTANTYEVAISATGYASMTSQVMITAGVTADLQSIYLTPIMQSSTLTGTVTDATTGQPITGAEVTVAGTNFSTKTDTGGTYTITGINLHEFDLKASHAGYDSAGYHVKTFTYGTFTLNLVLNLTSYRDIRIQSLATDRQSYPADTGIAISAQIENSGTEKTSVYLFAQVVDPLGAVVDVLYPTSPPTYVSPIFNENLIDIDPMSTTSAAFLGNTYQFVPGNYEVLLKAVDPLSETILAEASVSIEIVPSKKVRIVRITPKPTYSHVGATETVSLSLLFADLSNVPVQLEISHSLTTPGGVVLLSGSETLAKEPDAMAFTLPLGALTYTFTEQGSYPIDVTIKSGGETLAAATRALVISPTVYVEPSTSLMPDTVLPDGDKRIKVRIELKGVQQ